MVLKLIVIFLLFLQINNTFAAEYIDSKIHYLEAGNVKTYVPERRRLGFYESDIRIYCYRGSPKSLWRYFQTNYFQLDIETDDYTQYEGTTPEIVKAHHDEQKSIFSFNFLLSYKKTHIKLFPFEQTCVGIDTLQPYTIRLNLIRTDFWKICYFMIGALGFFFASTLSKNSIFYYLSGITLGVCASFVILVMLAGKLFPKRPMMYGVLIGGWTIAYYLFKLLWDNVQVILISYYSYVLWYVFVTGIISFIICYRMGPPTNVRSKNLIKWSLQLIALGFMFFSSEIQEASLAAMLLSVFLHYVPLKWIRYFVYLYSKWFPIRPRLLTLQEYNEQGEIETKKALDELREFCNSPKCKQWKTMTALKNPKRFAAFIEGEGHVMDEEIFDHESSKNDLTDSDENLHDKYFMNRGTPENLDDDNNISEDEVIPNPSPDNFRRSISIRRNGISPTIQEFRDKRNLIQLRSRSLFMKNRKILHRRYNNVEISDDDI